MRVPLAVAVLACAAGCAGATSTPVSETASPSAPAPTPSSPDHVASSGSVHPPADVQGTFNGGTNTGLNCSWVTDADGTRWEIGILPDGYALSFEDGVPVLSGQDGQVIARGGDRIGLNGIKDPPDIGSFCMIGRVFETKEVVWVER